MQTNQSTGVPQTTSQNLEEQIAAFIDQMTLAEKIGQMTQIEKNSLTPDDVIQYHIGSVLSGGGGNPSPNSPEDWRQMVTVFQEAALQSRLGIPLLYGVDAVHGHNNVKGAVIFPHNIGLGAANDEALVERIGQVTARELLATSVHWTFAPAVSVGRDIRWGRIYESYGEDTELVGRMGAALVRGLQDSVDGQIRGVAACVKHFVADGGTTWGTRKPTPWQNAQVAVAAPTSEQTSLQTGVFAEKQNEDIGMWQIDQGDSRIDEATLREVHLPPYRAAIDAGSATVMVSYSAWNGLKMHAQRYLLTDVLKGEMGFEGLIVSDWMAIDQIAPDYYDSVVASINAGLDLIMVPYNGKLFIESLTRAVANGDVSEARIDDAVRRNLRVKLQLGLFEVPIGDEALLADVGSPAHRAVAREAVRKSLVLLKNDDATLPLAKDLPLLLVAGAGADDVGRQCGGWSIDWQGGTGAITPGTTILDGIRENVSGSTVIEYSETGEFDAAVFAPLGLLVIAEDPYAEGFGDRSTVALSADEIALIGRVRQHCERLVVVMLSGRPRIITEQLPAIDALVAAWLPGTEGDGITDVLFGDHPFTGKLSFAWARDMNQIGVHPMPGEPLFPRGFGLS